MHIEVDIERGGEVHVAVKAYADEHGLRLPRAYAELLTEAVEQEGLK